jgi:DNA-binding transcriptional LysR family regulator
MAGTEQGKLVIGAIPTICALLLALMSRQLRAALSPRGHSHRRGLHPRASESYPPRGCRSGAACAASSRHLLSVPRTLSRTAVRSRSSKPSPGIVRPHAPAQIESDPFLLLKEGHCFRENVLSVCAWARAQPNVVFESGQIAIILAMVAAGSGISVVAQMAVEEKEGCRFIPLCDDSAYRRVGIVQLRHYFRSRVHRAFLEHPRGILARRVAPLRPARAAR